MVKKLGIYHRILIVILFTGIIFLLLLTILFIFKNKQEKLIYNASKEQFNNEVKSLIKINSERLRQIVFDYTYWDEFVANINKNDTSWFKSNITSIIDSFHFNYVLVYDSSFNLVHKAFLDSGKFIDIVPKATLHLLKEKKFINYYHFSNGDLYEISCASVHPTIDPEHKLTKPSGYLFLAKKWDKFFLAELSNLTASELKVKPYLDSIENEDFYTLSAKHKIYDWDNRQIAQVDFTRNSKAFRLYDRMSVYMFLIILIFVIIALLSFHFTTRKWISHPLKLVTVILAENKNELIVKLQNSPGEFKQIGKLFKEFIDQKEELKIAKERAEESDRLKTAFLANMSHEIRTPMNGILGFANLLREPMLSGEEQQQYISIIEKSGERMLNIINDLINISKVESGQMNVLLSETNINEQLEYVQSFFNPEASDKGIKLLINSTLPFNAAYIETDKEKLYAILTNLVKNALKFTDKGSIEFGYTIVEVQGIESILFFVYDTGIGIKKDKQAVIFDRFIQADLDNKRAFQGAGLGLSITKAFVELLGGKIWLESIPEKGSKFYFTIPYIPGASNSKKITSNYIDIKNIQLQNKLTILIVDDEEIVDVYLTMVVKGISKEILHAKDGVQALEIYTKNPHIDLILMDIQLPKMNGYEATQLIRTINQDVIIIAQTAYALTGDRENALEAGCNDYITKPVKKEELLELIQMHFSKR